jgi:hypothetical protein
MPENGGRRCRLVRVADRDGPTMFARIGLMRALNRQTEADHFGNKLKDGHPYRRLGGAVRSGPLEGLAAFLTRNLVVLTRRIPMSAA